MSGKSAVPGRGRKPKPNKQKQLSRSKHVNKDAVEFDEISNVDPPEWLDDLASQMWETVCPELCSKKVLAVTDLHNLEAFCTAYSTWRQAVQEVKDKGLVVEGATGGPIKNPACTVVNESLRHMSMFGASLGLDPAARGRLTGGSSGGGNTNQFAKF